MKIAGRLAGLLLTGFLGFALISHGCTPSNPGLEQSKAEYDAGRYASAFRAAKQIADDPLQPPAARQQAAYFAGVSAMKLNRPTEAQDYLVTASQSPDPGLSGDALAQLGLLYSQQGRDQLAAEHLLKAVEKMSGQDQANALFYAAVCQQRIGRFPQARTNLLRAEGISTDAQFRQKVQDQLRVTGFTVQVGAFSNEANARRRAEEVAPKSLALKLGRPRVIPSVDPQSNQRLFLVQVGEFISHPTATSGRESLALTSAIVVPLRTPAP